MSGIALWRSGRKRFKLFVSEVRKRSQVIFTTPEKGKIVKKIKITEENSEKLEEALRSVNGKANAHTIDSYETVLEHLETVQDMLRKILPKSAWKGATSICVPGGPTAGSYRYPVITTKLDIEFRATGAFLADASRVTVYPKEKERNRLFLTDVQRDEALRRFQEALEETKRC